MVFLVGLGKLIKRIWKKKTYRWLSYAICIITFSTLYDYIHSIITHTIICIPMWIWGIYPVVTILIFFAKFRDQEKIYISSSCIGMLLWNSGYWCFVCLVLYNRFLVHQFPYVPS